MIRRRTIAPKKKKDVKIELTERICRKCSNAYLMQSSKTNPIVSECILTKERFVASTPHIEKCGFKEREEEEVIHEMIYLK